MTDEVKPIKVPKFPTERKFSAWFSKLLRKEFGDDIVVVNVTGGPYSANGVSDLIICFFGIFFAMELKMDGKELTKLQLRFSMQVDRAGGRTLSPVTPSRALDALEYFRTIKQYRMGQGVIQSVRPDEAEEIINEGRADLAITKCDGEHEAITPCFDEECHLKGDAKLWEWCPHCLAETGYQPDGTCSVCKNEFPNPKCIECRKTMNTGNVMDNNYGGTCVECITKTVPEEGDLESSGFAKSGSYDD